jgi:hypothetical protein
MSPDFQWVEALTYDTGPAWASRCWGWIGWEIADLSYVAVDATCSGAARSDRDDKHLWEIELALARLSVFLPAYSMYLRRSSSLMILISRSLTLPALNTMRFSG